MSPEAVAVLDGLYANDAAQRGAGLPAAQRTRNVERETGRFLNLLVRSLGARSILEIGSSNGVSTIWLASAAIDTRGDVTGTEIIPERAAAANANLDAAGLASVARVLPGEGRTSASNLPGPFDLVFIDAEKEDYADHFLAVIDRVRPGGVVVADNVVSHDLSAYQSMLRARSDVDTVTLPLDRGLEYTVRIG